jgi:hypothetical protein
MSRITGVHYTGCSKRPFSSSIVHEVSFVLVAAQDATLLRDTFHASRVLRTMLGERCVLTHRGWAGEKRDFPNILLVLLGAPVSACRGVIPTVDGEMTLSCTTHNLSDAQGLRQQGMSGEKSGYLGTMESEKRASLGRLPVSWLYRREGMMQISQCRTDS